MRKETKIQSDLKAWALWAEREGGAWSTETTLARAMAGQLSETSFHSRIPAGCEAPARWMQQLIVAMGDGLSDPKQAKYIDAVRQYYLLGALHKVIPPKPVELVTIWRWVRRGEDILELAVYGTRGGKVKNVKKSPIIGYVSNC